MAKPKRFKLQEIEPSGVAVGDVILVAGSWTSHGVRWDAKGCCQTMHCTSEKPGKWKRCPEMDFGTPGVEALFPTWMQEAAMAANKPKKRKR